MEVLSHLEPKEVFYFFEEICKIPHGSGNVEQISNYLADFARTRNLFYIQDKVMNVIIIKEASEGYEKEPPLILQGHMDMVAVKKPELAMDMQKEGIKAAVEGDLVYAEGTSLGGDNGIAVAYALALLDDHTISHPRLEVVLTVDEEVGMGGAREIDLSMLRGSRMLNLDSDEEGIFLTSCAGGAGVDLSLPLAVTQKEGLLYEVKVGGLLGGHSGMEIHKERGNSNCLMARLLYSLTEKCEIGIREGKGGLADNAIPRETTVTVIINDEDIALLTEIADGMEAKLKEELAGKDPGVCIQIEQIGRTKAACVSGSEARKLAAYLMALPNGVQAMSADIIGLVETSLNLGVAALTVCNNSDDAASADPGSVPLKAMLQISCSVRSSVESAKQAMIDRLEAVTGLAGGNVTVSGFYPGWKYRGDSPLRDKMMRLYEKMYGAPPKVEAIHAGLECGLLGSKIPNLDCVSLGPDIRDIHTTEETLSISSTRRVWEFLVRLLEEMDEEHSMEEKHSMD